MLNDKLPGKCLGVQKQTLDDGEDSVGDDDFWWVWWRWRWRWRRYSGGGVGNNINDNNPCSNSLKPPFKPRHPGFILHLLNVFLQDFQASQTFQPPARPASASVVSAASTERKESADTDSPRRGRSTRVTWGWWCCGGGLLWDDDREGAKWYKMENKKGGEGEIQFRSRLAHCFADVLQAF